VWVKDIVNHYWHTAEVGKTVERFLVSKTMGVSWTSLNIKDKSLTVNWASLNRLFKLVELTVNDFLFYLSLSS
jgi:hypothetical protein